MNHSRRSAFTLVELLVVSSILAVLFGLVMAGGRGQRTTIRRAALEFASQLLAAQSRALGRPEGAAVLLETLDAVPTDAGRFARVLHEATTLPPSVVNVNGTTGLLSEGVPNAYKARVLEKAGDGRLTVSPWLGVNGSTLTPRNSAGQNQRNTLLKPRGQDLEALVLRYPVAGPRPTRLPDQVAVDLDHSGLGENPTASHNLGRLTGKGPIAIVFDQTGRVAEVIPQAGATQGTAPNSTVPNETLYFLFAEYTEGGDNRSLESDKSIWVAINPQTGRINVSSNVPSADPKVAREKARKAIAVGK